MCLIIYRRKDNPQIAESNIINASENNQDGFGLIYHQDGKVKIEKTMDMARALPMIRELEAKNKRFLAHFRYATHGDVNLTNCHPFEVSGIGAMVHNGVVDVEIQDKKFSDTWHLVEELKDFRKWYQNHPLTVTKTFISEKEKAIGSSKLGFMFENGRVYIHNYELGHTESGVWYSNEWSLLPVYYNWGVWEKQLDYYDIQEKIWSQGFKAVTAEDLLSLDVKELAKVLEDFPRECAEILAIHYDY